MISLGEVNLECLRHIWGECPGGSCDIWLRKEAAGGVINTNRATEKPLQPQAVPLLLVHLILGAPAHRLRSVTMETKVRLPFVLIVSLLCDAYFLFSREPQRTHRRTKRATKAAPAHHDLHFLSQWDLRGNSVALQIPRGNAQSYSLAGFSGVKLNPRSTWKSSHTHCNRKSVFFVFYFFDTYGLSFFSTFYISIYNSFPSARGLQSFNYHIMQIFDLFMRFFIFFFFLVDWVKILPPISSPDSYIFIISKELMVSCFLFIMYQVCIYWQIPC